MEIKFKKLHEDAVLPSYAKAGDAALDVTATSDGEFIYSKEGEDIFAFLEYKTGLSAEIPEGYVGLLFPRSSVSKTALSLCNCVGIWDSGFRGEVRFRFKLDSFMTEMAMQDGVRVAKYKKGDRIGQLMIIPRPFITPVWADTLTETERGEGGFGSSGK